MADKKGQVNLVFSKDGGQTFDKPIRIDEGKPIGRVDVLMLDSATAMASWMEGSSIKAVKVNMDGKKESSILIASSSEARSSGFPQMTKSGNRIIFAWTDDVEKNIKIHVPTATMWTVLPLTVHFVGVWLVKVTARPEFAVALTPKSASPNVLLASAPKVML